MSGFPIHHQHPEPAQTHVHRVGDAIKTSAGKEYACNEGDLGLFSGLGRSSGGGKGYPLLSFLLKESFYFFLIFI